MISSEIIRKCGRTIVFCRTRAGADRVGDDLTYDGLASQTLHGGLSQKQRDRAMQRFQHGECMALVATDVAARGIDVEGVNCVIHYDPPENGKAYKHRSGRTARGGSSGVVFSLVQKPQKKSYSKIQKAVGINTEFTPPDFSLIPEFEVEFIGASRRRSQGSRNRNDSRTDNRNQRNKGHYGTRNRPQTNKSAQKNNKRAYNKKKPQTTHSRPNRGNKSPNKPGNKSGFSNNSRGVIGVVETKEIEDNLKSISRYYLNSR